jgi:hypothetical protein
MRRSVATLALSGALAGGALLAATVPASAQAEGTGSDASEETRSARHRRHRLVRGIVRQAAETIGVEARDLVAELRSGQSLAQVAEAHGVATQDLVDALVAAGNERIDQAVADGHLSEERASEIREELPERVERIVQRVPGERRARAAD